MKIVKNILPLREFLTPDNACMPLSIKQTEYIKAFNQAVIEKSIKFEEVPCLCGWDEFDLVAKYDRYSMLQQTVMCRRCGLILSNPRMTEEEYARFYETDIYRRCYTSVDYLDECRKNYNSSTGRHIFNAIIKVKVLNEIKSVLEFGAAGGWNLIPFKEKGASVTGYDYSPSLVALGREYGLDLFQGSLCEVGGKYDVIILNHVVEHFTDVIGSIKRLTQHLSPGGIFYIAVPDIRNFSMGQLQNAHTYYFTLPTLRYYMAKCGLKLLHSEPAEGMHLAAVFLNESSVDLSINFLSDHPQEMIRVLRNYRTFYIKKFLYESLQLARLIKIIKKNVKPAIGNKPLEHKSWEQLLNTRNK